MREGNDMSNSMRNHEGDLNLGRPEVLRYFSSIAGNRAGVLGFIQNMDRVDRWAVDHQEFDCPGSASIAFLLSRVQTVISKNVSVIDQAPRELLGVLAHLTTSRCIFLFHYITHHNAKVLPAIVSVEPQLDDAGRIDLLTLQRRIVVLERAQILDNIFSRKRLAEVSAIMRLGNEKEK